MIACAKSALETSKVPEDLIDVFDDQPTIAMANKYEGTMLSPEVSHLSSLDANS